MNIEDELEQTLVESVTTRSERDLLHVAKILILETRQMRDELKTIRRIQKGEVWYWNGDEEDHLETLTCPVIIEPGVLRDLLYQFHMEKEVARQNEISLNLQIEENKRLKEACDIFEKNSANAVALDIANKKYRQWI